MPLPSPVPLPSPTSTSPSRVCKVLALLLVFALPAVAADWPMWGYDAGRTFNTPSELTGDLHLQWMRELPAPKRAWPPQGDDAEKLSFDVSYYPVVAGDKVFVPSMVTDSVTAYAVKGGEQVWRYFADGPVRLAPVAWKGAVYFASDDGYLHCLDAENGALRWKFRGGPPERRLLGNERIIDMWAARGGPVVSDGVVYFAAGIWPFMGIFIHALDAESGDVVWSNSGTGSEYQLHQHGGAYAFGGITPHGYMAVAGDKLIVAGGRTVPAVFDRGTGEQDYFRMDSTTVGKGAGGYRVMTDGTWYFNPGWLNPGRVYKLENGSAVAEPPVDVLTPDAFVGANRGSVNATTSAALAALGKDDKLAPAWSKEVPRLRQLHLRAGKRFFASGSGGRLLSFAMDDLLDEATFGEVTELEERVDGEVFAMLAAQDRLFVTTEAGTLYCFGPEAMDSVRHEYAPTPAAAGPDSWNQSVARMTEESGVRDGYALLLGAGSGRLLDVLLAETNLHILVLEPDTTRVAALREHLVATGMHGTRASVLGGTLDRCPLPSYLFSLMTSEDAPTARSALGEEVVETLLASLRPYGGTLYLPNLPSSANLARMLEDRIAGLPGFKVLVGDDSLSVRRAGPLPGAGQWTHQYSSAANTNFSTDILAMAPLGVLWYGGPSNENILPRHAQGPVPQVVEGKIILPGVDTISARDVYSGRELWVRQLPGSGHPFTNLEHEAIFADGGWVYLENRPGANYIGSHFVSTRDSIYVRYRGEIFRLDADTGEIVAKFPLPTTPVAGENVDWGHMSVAGDMLVTTIQPQIFDSDNVDIGGLNWNATSSKGLRAMNRHTGDLIWEHTAKIGLRHNAIVSGAGRIYVIDGLTQEATDRLARRGLEPDQRPRLMALDARSGKVIWTHDDEVFGTWLSYSDEHDILIQAGRRGGKRDLPDEPNERMAAHRGGSGEQIWHREGPYAGPLTLHGENILPGKPGEWINLLTGEPVPRHHPLTGEEVPWSYNRTYGCGTHIVSEHLQMFRSGSAGYNDLLGGSGTGNLGGFKSGCTNNLIVADGVVSAPDYTRTCACSYQMQTSLALLHMPDMDMWTYFGKGLPAPSAPIARIGINFGAPGNRMDDTGLLWQAYPEIDDKLPIEVADARSGVWFNNHSSTIVGEGGGLAWVAASGGEGFGKIQVANLRSGTYTVRVHFAETEEIGPGERVFDLRIGDETALEGYDIVKAAGGPLRVAVTEFERVVDGAISFELRPREGSKHPAIISGIELRIKE